MTVTRKMLIVSATICTLFCTSIISCKNTKRYRRRKEVYEPTWQSLEKAPIPKWMLDAKFGIYAHWGVYSVPAFYSEWYGKYMYEEGTKVYRHHVALYAEPSNFGYKDFIPMFKAQNYDPGHQVFCFSNVKLFT